MCGPICAHTAPSFSLDLSDCPHIGDNALFYLSKGCRKLKYVSLMNDELVTDAGVASLAAGCKLLRVLNLDRCINVHNDGIIAIGMHCANLLSLNARGLSSLTDHALSAIALGCPKLQALNIAGAKKVTEAGLCALAQHCRNLQTLNVGGCELVTRNGLLALIQVRPCAAVARLCAAREGLFPFLVRTVPPIAPCLWLILSLPLCSHHVSPGPRVCAGSALFFRLHSHRQVDRR